MQRLFMVVCIVLFLCPMASATPLYYTFKIQEPNDYNLSELSFLIDLENYSIGHFNLNYEASYVSGFSSIQAGNIDVGVKDFIEGMPSDSTYDDIVQAHASGWTTFSHGDIECWITGSDNDGLNFYLMSNAKTTFDWDVGYSAFFYVESPSFNNPHYFSSSATISSISENPVPEPTSILLFVLAIVGYLGKYKFLKSNKMFIRLKCTLSCEAP